MFSQTAVFAFNRLIVGANRAGPTSLRHHAARVSGIGHDQLLPADQSHDGRGAAV